jgi:glycosyltransferase involved in cell wall biosynthesis
MRVVLVSTYDLTGGANRAAYRLLQGLRAAGEDCSMLVREKFSADRDVQRVARDTGPLAKQREREAGRIHEECVQQHRTEMSNTWFSLPVPGYDLSRHERIQRADVIHLHWVSHLLSPWSIGELQKLGPPVLWTLHDQRPFTGGCHYSAGCRRFEMDCQPCPQLGLANFALTGASLRESLQFIGRNLVVVCPSRWMGECARRSAVFKGARIEIIPNGIDTDVFKPRRAAARKDLGFDPAGVYLLAGADNDKERRKGFPILHEAIRICLAQPPFREAVMRRQVSLVFFGNAKPLMDLSFPAQWLGRFDSEEELAKVYAACDAYLLPSAEDNLPNTVLESLCSGTPVVGFEVGGVPDAIEHGENGLLVPAGDAEQLARAIQRFVTSSELRRKLTEGCSAQCRARFSLAEQARRHRELYEELCRSSQAASPLEPALPVQPLAPFGQTFGTFYPALCRRAKNERLKKRWRSFCGRFKFQSSNS